LEQNVQATGRGRMSKAPLLFALVILLTAIANAVEAGSPYSFQVGAWGDSASAGNMGVQVEIQTRIYGVYSPDLTDSFWVGDNLDNGTFIQFGYLIEPGYFCGRGEILGGKSICTGRAYRYGSSDAHWFWQYWPNGHGEDYHYASGAMNSAGTNGTWHNYTISLNVEGGWGFVFDGRTVDSIPFGWTHSRNPVYVAAEKVTSSSKPGVLGPVEFRNLAYLKEDGWHSVNALFVLRACGFGTNCAPPNPYGVGLHGPNQIVAGSGQTQLQNLALLWARGFYLTLQVPSTVHVIVNGTDRGQGPVQLFLPPASYEVSVPETVQIDNSTRLAFSNWSDGSFISNHTVNLGSNLTIRAEYHRQYLVTINPGLDMPNTSLWEDEGWPVDFSVPDVRVPMDGLLGVLGGKWMFDGWFENGSLVTSLRAGVIVVGAPHALNAHWQPDIIMPVAMLVIVAVLTAWLVYRRKHTEPLPESKRENSSTIFKDVLYWARLGT
jgi:hypothetical protein